MGTSRGAQAYCGHTGDCVSHLWSGHKASTLWLSLRSRAQAGVTGGPRPASVWAVLFSSRGSTRDGTGISHPADLVSRVQLLVVMEVL